MTRALVRYQKLMLFVIMGVSGMVGVLVDSNVVDVLCGVSTIMAATLVVTDQ